MHLASFCLAQSQWEEELGEEIENLDATQNGESSEESHGASNKPKGTDKGHLKLNFPLSLDLTQKKENILGLYSH